MRRNGVLEFWSFGVLEFWSFGVLEKMCVNSKSNYSITPKLHFSNTPFYKLSSFFISKIVCLNSEQRFLIQNVITGKKWFR